jgi:NADH-quinone oxidoreductase subunit L
MGGKAAFEAYLEPVFARLTTDAPLIEHFTDPGLEWFILIAAVVFSLYAVFLGVRFYFAHPEIPKRVAKRFRGLYTLFAQQYYLNQLYQSVLVLPYKKLGLHLWHFWDDRVIRKAVQGFSLLWIKASFEFRKTQSGNLAHYLVVLGFVLVLLLILKGF